MKYSNNLDFQRFIGKHTLLYGETNTQKTYLTARFIEFLINEENVNQREITILDFAPKLEYIDQRKIGGRIQDYYSESLKCNYINYKKKIIPPRLKATNKKELFKNLCHNFNLTSKLLKNFNENPTSILIINDLSIHLHLGDKNEVLETIYMTETFFGNSYYGTSINKKFASLLGILERKRVDYLIENIEKSILIC